MKRMISMLAMMTTLATAAGTSACVKGRDHEREDQERQLRFDERLEHEANASTDDDAPADGQELEQLRAMERRFQSAREAYYE